jgi:hypothetical protein
MPKASRQTASESVEVEGYEGHFEHFDDGYPPPGHTPVLYAGAEVVEFSPTDELARTLDVVTKNMEAAGG